MGPELLGANLRAADVDVGEDDCGDVERWVKWRAGMRTYLKMGFGRVMVMIYQL